MCEAIVLLDITTIASALGYLCVIGIKELLALFPNRVQA